MSIANGYGPNWTTAESRGLDAQRRIAELEQQLAAAQAEVLELRERSAHVDRGATRLAIEKDTLAQQLARVRELPAKWRAAPQNPDEPLLAIAADELDAALSQPAEQHDPLAVSDHCGECGEPEPECACDERIEDYRPAAQESGDA